MQTSQAGFLKRLIKVDDLARRDHYYLDEQDHCFFFGEYTSKKGYDYSKTNQLIFNFKKSVDRRGKPDWRYKEQAIRTIAQGFQQAIGEEKLRQITFVPMPPSKAKDDPLYDDRMVRMLNLIQTPPVDVRVLIVQNQSMLAAHGSENRPPPQILRSAYRLETSLMEKAPINCIAIVDDVLTTGSHFKAAQLMLNAHVPEVPIFGIFVARRVPCPESES